MAIQKPTIKDIARECGVSLSTVSLVMNNNPRISQATRSKVLAAVEKYDYQPNVQARGLVSQSSQVLSVAVPALSRVFADIYFGEIVSGVYDSASENGFKILLDIARDRFVRNQEYLSLLKSRRADGMLFIGASIADEYLKDFERENYPFLLVNHYFPGSALNYLTFDYRECGRLAARHLLELGHRRIGLLAGTNTYTGIDFRDAFVASCRDAGIDANDVVVENCDWNEMGGYQGAERLHQRRPDLTALMGSNDRMAIGAIRYLHTRNIRVPDTISVMGMDDIEAARFSTPGLTTVRQELYELGRSACRRLLEMVSGDLQTCQESLSGTLITRESTSEAAVS